MPPSSPTCTIHAEFYLATYIFPFHLYASQSIILKHHQPFYRLFCVEFFVCVVLCFTFILSLSNCLHFVFVAVCLWVVVIVWFWTFYTILCNPMITSHRFVYLFVSLLVVCVLFFRFFVHSLGFSAFASSIVPIIDKIWFVFFLYIFFSVLPRPVCVVIVCFIPFESSIACVIWFELFPMYFFPFSVVSSSSSSWFFPPHPRFGTQILIQMEHCLLVFTVNEFISEMWLHLEQSK